MSESTNKYVVSVDDIEEARALTRRQRSIPGTELRRQSIEAAWRFGRLGSHSGRSDQYVEIRALDCTGPRWTYRPDPKGMPDFWLDGTAVGYFREIDDVILALESGGDGHEHDPACSDKWLSTNAELRPLGYYFVPVVFEPSAIHTDLGVGLEVGHDGWQVPYGNKLIQDCQVQRVNWISIDNDPSRPTDDEYTELNANEDEHALALATALKQLQLFEDLGVPRAALGLGSSGNGARADLAVDLPAGDDFQPLVKGLLGALDRIFTIVEDGKPVLKVDQNCSNKARLLPLFGTVKCKAPHTEERPRARSWFQCEDVVEPLTKEEFQELVEKVEAVAETFPAISRRSSMVQDLTPPTDLEAISTETRVNRARAYVQKVAPAVSKEAGGDGRHRKYVSVIGRVVQGFALEEDEALDVLRPWHESCVPPKSDREFEGIVKWAAGSSGRTPWGGLLGTYEPPCQAEIEKSSLGVLDDEDLDEGDREALAELGVVRESIPVEVESAECQEPMSDDYGEPVSEEGQTVIITRTVGQGDSQRLIPRPLRENVETYLRSHQKLRGVVRWDDFKAQPVMSRMPPWAASGGAASDTKVGAPWRDLDSLRLGSYLAHDVGMVGMEKSKIDQAVLVAAREKPFNSLRKRLRATPWDGVPRVDNWLSRYATVDASRGFEDEPTKGARYTSLVGRWWLIEAVARAEQPGCQADYCLVLEGEQGIQKSSLLRVLAGDEYFSDGDLGDLKDKESAMALQGVWIQELGEGEIFKRASQQQLKAFTTVRVDHYIPKFANFPTKVPRTNVFAITTNDAEYLADRTGGRRWWPVHLEDIDLELLAREVDQLWAEALFLFQSGERWWPATEEEKALCAQAVGERTLDDPWEETIRLRLRELVEQDKGISALGVASAILDIKVKDSRNGHEVRKVREILRKLGWVKGPKDGRRGQLWVRGPSAEPHCPSDEIDEAVQKAWAEKNKSGIPTFQGASAPEPGEGEAEAEA